MIRTILHQIQVNVRKRLRWRVYPSIIVYQMGKVGSQTVYASLQRAGLPNPIYHVHFLSHEGIEENENYYQSKNLAVPNHLHQSKILRQEIEAGNIRHLKIITLVREPISREISNLFQNVELYPQILDQHGNINPHEIIQVLQNHFLAYDELTDYTCTWFDREFKSTCHLDVYAHPFDHERGFMVIKDTHLDILLLRLENLNENFQTALSEFLQINLPIELIPANVTEKKSSSTIYKDILKQMIIPESVCRAIYSSKYARHFYSEQMRQNLIQKWSTGSKSSVDRSS